MDLERKSGGTRIFRENVERRVRILRENREERERFEEHRSGRKDLKRKPRGENGFRGKIETGQRI